MQNELVTPYLKIWIEGGILCCVYADKLSIDLEVAKKCVADRIAFVEGRSYACMIDMRGIHMVSKEARDYFADEGSTLITAGALIIGNPLTRMLGNIFLQVSKPKVPLRLFSDEKNAMQWLKKQEYKSAVLK
ncbi:MAG TPA: STAS/SEC14 domain-containing protein [Bacteroidia bacterium]|nr:STAS/SEC14 domain-containing protein [Bacteroidia bacterium]